MMVLNFYSFLMRLAAPLLERLLRKRAARGKEDLTRLDERRGIAARPRPAGPLIWLHAASVGEAQSALILIEKLHALDHRLHFLVTTGTVTSAELMARRLPASYAFHHYVPLDHPDWVARFLDHWRPDLALWLESELWPNMLAALRARQIPAILINARLSPRSARRWGWFRGAIKQLLQSFSLILTQTDSDKAAFERLGGQMVICTGNLKYSAAPLPYDPQELTALTTAIDGRPVWLYASTHAGEEELAYRLHKRLSERSPSLLTIIVPRHPERRDEIARTITEHGLSCCLRGQDRVLPAVQDSLYIADTLGELGLFYRAVPLACIGRSFSDDGGGGHNPIEAAQLGCAVLHGPYVQNLQAIFDEMDQAGAALPLPDEAAFATALDHLLSTPEALTALQDKAKHFAAGQNQVIEEVVKHIIPHLPSD